ADGRQRPLGVPALEDKIVQRAVVEVLNAIYEADFLAFSYGFRPGRSPHHALDALATGIHRRRVNWVLDADIRSFFDTLDHGWLVKFLEHRIADRRVVRLIQKWLKAGVLEEGKRTPTELGTVQGGSISPRTEKVISSADGVFGAAGGRGTAIVRRYRRDGDAVADDDDVITDHHLLDDEAHDPLALGDLERLGGRSQAGEEGRERLGEPKVCGSISDLFDDRLQ